MGTTSEELKKLYKKLGGKDPKVAGFSAPGEILNAINEIPLPTEYELPTVTTEDAGDVLVVNEEGKWDKGEAGGGLPEVTTDDNGDILQVVNGAWAKKENDIIIIPGSCTGGYFVFDDTTMTGTKIQNYITSGKCVILHTHKNNDVPEFGDFTYIGNSNSPSGYGNIFTALTFGKTQQTPHASYICVNANNNNQYIVNSIKLAVASS